MVTFSLYSGLDLDGALMKPTMNFLQKLSADPTNPSLKIKTLSNAVDKRVRTGRINDQFRAVLFEIKDQDTHHFVLVDVDSHDEGILKAERLDPARLRLDVNPINGITTLIKEEPVAGAGVAESQVKAEAAALAARELAAQQAKAVAEEKGVEAELVEKQSPAPREVLGELTPEKLWEELGIDRSLTEQVLALESEDGLDALLQSRPKWEHEAVLALVAGYSVEETRDSLGLRKVTEAEAAESEDARLLAGLRRAAAELEFAYVDDVETESLRSVIESGSFDQWRVYIHPEQRRMAEASYKKSARVFGGAGTGKTVVAVHRANNLVTGRVPEAGTRVLLTTFTKGLAQGLKSQLNALNPSFPEAGDPGKDGVWVDNIDAVVRKVVSLGTPEEVEEATRRVLGVAAPRVRPYTEMAARQVWEGALEGADETMSREIANEAFLQAEYETVVLANRITSQAEYLKVARAGRGTPLNRKQRKQVWAVLESLMQTQAIDGQLFWPTMSAVGAEILNVRYEPGGSMFDHVVVDEAQDFNAGHWRFLRACVAKGANDIFIAEDSHQRIYGNPLTLSHFGISTRGRASRRLTLNYRTTKENLDYALRILVGGDMDFLDAEGAVDSVGGYRSARSGPAPMIVSASSEDEEFAVAAALINGWLEEAEHAAEEGKHKEVRVGVMCRTRGQLSRVVSGLADEGIDAVQTKNAELASHEQVSVMTMHGAKGMEFTHVILMGVGKEVMPLRFRLKNLSEEDARSALQRERSLLYVAASRARDALVITTVGERSELLPEG
ncbi:UvrD-like helicase family protein [Corynebacterium mucifaciens]|uniref:3'-5' exonuclease n=1 Tax=Corynebacterium ureicelerivorans TaxID=401472 RepID=UPI00264AA0B9|nr:3'-5' exonuclease [Corynebacterium ureicelerivorans]MDN8626253.1 3'-5' exonuclease [Corynebacterium ureicelerivorans]